MTAPSLDRPLKIGTRGSPLALAQANETRRRLCAANGWAEDGPMAPEIVTIRTSGDKMQKGPLAAVGGKGLFTKEIEEALLAGDVDLAVHSMKDVPGDRPAGLEIVAILPREDARDAFLSLTASSLSHLPMGAVVGSTSLRRKAQLLAARPDLEVIVFRGNVETRIAKMAAGEVHATLLAVAGLNRLGRADEITSVMDTDVMLPAAAQGAVGLEIREDDTATRACVAPLNHEESALRVWAERGFLNQLDGSCRTPIAAHATLDDGRLHLRGLLISPDGKQAFRAERHVAAAQGAEAGADAGREVRAAAGEPFFEMIRALA